MKIGYIRVSTLEQNTIRQEVLMRELGVDELYIDKASGKSSDRPELRKMIQYVRKGDTVIVEAISRFARNTKDLLELVEQLTASYKVGAVAIQAVTAPILWCSFCRNLQSSGRTDGARNPGDHGALPGLPGTGTAANFGLYPCYGA